MAERHATLIAAAKWINSAYKYLILIAVAVGFLIPYAAPIMRAAVPLVVAGIIFSLGLTAQKGSFLEMTREPNTFIAGLALTFVAAPLTGATIANGLLAQSPDLAFGLILTSSVGCGNAVGTWTALAGGDIPLALAILTASTALTPFTTPLLASVLGGRYLSFDPTKTLIDLSMMILAPLIVSRMIALKASEKIKGLEQIPLAFSSILAMLLGYVVVGNASPSLFSILPVQVSALLIVSVVIQSAIGFSIGYAIPRFILKVKRGSTVAVTYATGSKNNSIAMAIALAQFSGLAALPAMIYLLAQIGISSLALSRFQKHR